MCLAIPMKITRIENKTAYADVGGVEYAANIELLKDVNIGDYIIVHAGFAIEKLDEKTAQESLAIWKEIAAYDPSKIKKDA